MAHSSWRDALLGARAPLLSLWLVALAACPSPTAGDNRYLQIVASAFDDTVTPGEDVVVQVVLSRQNGFNQALVLHQQSQSASAPSFDDVAVPDGQNTVNLTVHTTATMAVKSYTLFLQANSPTGGTYASTYFTVTLIQPGTFQFTLSDQFPTAGPGAQLSTILRIARSDFPQAITLSATTPTGSGITAAFVGPNPTTAAEVTINVSVPNNLAAGQYQVDFKGISGVTQSTIAYRLTVTSAAASTVAWTFCPTSGLPLLVAKQDGSGAWSAVAGSNNVYSFAVATGTGAIAYVLPRNSGTQLVVFYGSLTDLQEQGTHACAAGTGPVKTVSGTVANTGTASSVLLSLGDAFKFLGGAAGAFTMNNVPPGPLDLIAATLGTSGGNTQLLRMVLRSNQNLPDNGVLAAVDFTGAESFAPNTATLTMQNTLGHIIAMSEFYHSAYTAFAPLYFESTSSSATTRTIYGVPTARMGLGDVLWISADALTGTGSSTEFRTAAIGKSITTDAALAFGPPLDPPQVTVLASVPYPRLRSLFLWQQEYPGFWQADFTQSTGANRRALIQVTSGYRGPASPVVIDIPDLSGVAGWSNSYGLAPGVQANWTTMAAGWSLPGGTTFAPIRANSDYRSATKQGVVTP